jgi:hypothetical protein
MLGDSQDMGTSYFDDEDDDQRRALAGLISPAPAHSLVPPPPDSPPQSGPAQSTPRTGSLAMAPQQAQPSRSGPDMLPGRAVLPENISQGSNSGTVPALTPAGAGGSLQPAAPAARPDARNVTIRDMNGESLGTAPRNALPALRPAVTQALSARAGSWSAAQPQPGSQPLVPAGIPVLPTGVSGVAPASAPVMPANAGRFGVQPANPAGQVQPATPSRLNLGPSTISPQLNAQTQAYGGLLRQRAQYPGPTTLDAMPASPGNSSSMPLLPATASDIASPGEQKLAQDQQKLAQLQAAPYGGSQIKRPWLRDIVRGLDIAGSVATPGVMRFVPQSTIGHQVQVERQLGVVGGDQSQLQAAAQLANTRSQQNERDAMGRRYDAQANLYNPEPLPAGQAQALGHPEWEGLRLDARDAERLVGGAARNQTTLQTHFGGQQRKLSADDAAAIGTPSLEGASMSNDEYQRLLQGAQHNQQLDTNNQRTTGQSDTNNRRNNATRITATGMRDATSEDNSNRAHPGGGSPKPIPAGIRDRIESQKNTAINKARAAFDNGESTQDDYLDNWQSAQNDYEDRLSAQTGGPIPHTDIRSNVDAKGNWIGNRSQPGAPQPQAQPGRSSTFVTQKGNRVAIGDPVNVRGRTGTVTGFNPQTGKAQIRWAGAN